MTKRSPSDYWKELYHRSPARRAQVARLSIAWRKLHPERAKEIQAKATKKWRGKNRERFQAHMRKYQQSEKGKNTRRLYLWRKKNQVL